MTHDCPGGCGAPVANHRFACKQCWFRLPKPLRDAINGVYKRDTMAHLQAMSEARRWYRANAEVSR